MAAATNYCVTQNLYQDLVETGLILDGSFSLRYRTGHIAKAALDAYTILAENACYALSFTIPFFVVWTPAKAYCLLETNPYNAVRIIMCGGTSGIENCVLGAAGLALIPIAIMSMKNAANASKLQKMENELMMELTRVGIAFSEPKILDDLLSFSQALPKEFREKISFTLDDEKGLVLPFKKDGSVVKSLVYGTMADTRRDVTDFNAQAAFNFLSSLIVLADYISVNKKELEHLTKVSQLISDKTNLINKARKRLKDYLLEALSCFPLPPREQALLLAKISKL